MDKMVPYVVVVEALLAVEIAGSSVEIAGSNVEIAGSNVSDLGKATCVSSAETLDLDGTVQVDGS
jgi:hypothetical protein